ncbi:MAG: DNA polymerase I [Deltaproteobacteria bacterium]|jgi:DNA polymerase-1|nr:DNA polymerase I [Deltaproteobacteria bacterium]
MSLQERLSLARAPVFLMDGAAFIYRSYYANREMQRSDGFPTNALFVMARLLLRLLREEKPAHFLVLLDGHGPHFRHELFPLYKANRDATPETLVLQLEPIRRFMRALGLPVEISDGCEADDCIASLAKRFAGECPVVIVGADKDLKQCLAPDVYLWDPAAKEEKLLSLEQFSRENGLTPAQWPDMQALLGDSADNIPGIPGIGPKTAAKILQDFPTLEAIRDGFDALPPKLQDRFRPHLDAMFLYRRLTTLRLDVCRHLTLADLALAPPKAQELAALCGEYEMHSLRRDVESLLRACAPGGRAVSPSAKEQVSLFSVAALPATAPLAVKIGELPPCAEQNVAILPSKEGGNITYSVALGGRAWRYAGPLEDLIAWLAPARRIVTPDAKQLLKYSFLWRQRLPLCFDVSLAAYLINPEERDYSWPHLYSQWSQRLDGGRDDPGLLALKLAVTLEQRLETEELAKLYHGLELPLIPVLAELERRGVAVDLRAFDVLLAEVQQELDRLTAFVHKAAGGPFNIRSAQQLGELLFGVLKLAPAGKTKGGQLSTAQDALEKLSGAHPVVDAVLEFRKLEKLRSTYLEPLPRLVDGKGRLHTSFNQLATATGRLSSSNPNLQNIPVRGPLGQRMRACFTAGPGMALVSADYSQVELRVLAHMSRDPALLEAFRQGVDIHARTAALLYDLPLEAVSPERRRSAKTVNFGLLYGMGPHKLAQELKVPMAEAKAFIQRYFSRLDGLKKFYDSIEANAREHGSVTTLAGRRRLLPDIHSQNQQIFALARRQAINTVIQGSAADVIKLAMLAVFHDRELARMQAVLLLQVHDELLLEVPREHAQAAGERMAELMRSVRPGGVELCVPLPVDWGYGANWAQAH